MAVNEYGDWYAVGNGDDDKGLRQEVEGRVGVNVLSAVHFVECDVPLPHSETVTGRVVETSAPPGEGAE